MLKKISKKWNKFERKITHGFTLQQKKLWEILMFMLRFVALAAPLHLLIWLNINVMFLQNFTSFLLDKALALTSINYAREGIFFILETPTGKMTIEIVRDCIAWKSMLALIGLIFAVRRVDFKKRIYGILIGIPLIFMLNILRLTTTFYFTAIRGVEFFQIIHSFLWQWGLVFIVLAIWVFWLNHIQ